HLEEVLTQRLLGPAGVFQSAQGGQPVGGQGFAGLFIAGADNGLAWVDLVPDAVVDAGEDRSGRQVWVGIGAADAVFDVAAVGRAARYAERYGAVVHPPALGQRRVAVGLEAAEGV